MVSRFLVLGLLLLGFVSLIGPAAADDTKTQPPADAAKIAALVQRLGSEDFETREAATAELEKLGKAAQKALEIGAKSDDLEIRTRSTRLLALTGRTEIEIALDAFLADKDTKLILKLPAWERFKKIAGDDTDARQMFVEMHTMEGGLFASLDRNPRQFTNAFNKRCQEILQNMYTPQGIPNPVPMGQVVALLFVSTDSRAPVNADTFYMMTNLLYLPNVQENFKANPSARKLLAQFFERQTDPNVMQQAIQLAMQYEFKELMPMVLKTAANKKMQAQTRAQAVMAISKLGTKENLKDLEPLLTDTTNIGTISLGGGTGRNRTPTNRITTEMRDVALASMIVLCHQNLRDYNFPYLKLILQQQPQQPTQDLLLSFGYTAFGFADNTQRDAAMKQFKAARAKEENKDK